VGLRGLGSGPLLARLLWPPALQLIEAMLE
jgi:hypothetical protein